MQMVKVTPRPDDIPELQTDLENIETIAFGGAGVTGVAYTGAMKALDEKGLLGNVKHFAGTSSGAICALGAALGYRGDGLIEIALKQDFKSFCRTNPGWAKRLRTNMARDGLFSGGEMRRWINNLCAKRIGQDALSFNDLEEYRQQAELGNISFFEEKYHWAMEHKWHFRRHSRNKDFTYDFERETAEASVEAMMEIARGFRSLDVGATEIVPGEDGKEKEKPVLFSAKNTPNLTLASAVRASAAYPYVFRHAHIPDEEGEMRIYTDGGFTLPLPVHPEAVKGQEKPKTLAFSSEFFPDKPQEIGVQVKTSSWWARAFNIDIEQKLKEMIARSVGKKIIESEGLKKKDSLEAGLQKMNRDALRFHIKGALKRSNLDLFRVIIPLDRDGVSGTDFNISDRKQENLVESAYETTLLAIQRWREKSDEKQLIGGVTPKPPIRPSGERDNEDIGQGK